MADFKDPKVTIKIPRALYNRIKTIIEESGFDSVTDFVVYVLRDFAAGAGANHLAMTENTEGMDASQKNAGSGKPGSKSVDSENTTGKTARSTSAGSVDGDQALALTAREIRKVRERLKRLGYL